MRGVGTLVSDGDKPSQCVVAAGSGVPTPFRLPVGDEVPQQSAHEMRGFVEQVDPSATDTLH